VCVNPTHAKLCAGLLAGSPVKVCVVVGFPLGATTPEIKALEAKQAIENGATEIDMVINIGALKDRNLELVARDILAVVRVVHAAKCLLKVIIETALLNDEEKQMLDTYGGKVDFTDKNSIQPIIDHIKELDV